MVSRPTPTTGLLQPRSPPSSSSRPQRSQALPTSWKSTPGRSSRQPRAADMDAAEDEQLVEALARSWKTSASAPSAGFLKAERDAYLASQPPTAEEQAAKAAEEAQAAAEERHQREAELWASVSQLALDPQLLDRLLLYAAEAGIIGEGPAVLAVFLVCASRLLVGRALCLLRRGAPASGKNFVPDVITKLMPPEAIIQLNGRSCEGTSILWRRGRERPSSAKSSMSPRPPAWRGVMATSRRPSPCFAR